MSEEKKTEIESISPELAPFIKQTEEICERIAGGESLRAMCKDAHLPSRDLVFKWLREGQKADAEQHLKDFINQYAHAREAQGDTIFDECLDIADNKEGDYHINVKTETGEIKVSINQENIQRAKLQIETRLKMAGKLRPKKYGDKLELTTDPINPLHSQRELTGQALIDEMKRRGLPTDVLEK